MPRIDRHSGDAEVTDLGAVLRSLPVVGKSEKAHVIKSLNMML